MVTRQTEEKELEMAGGGCVLTVFAAWWCIVQRKPAIAKALQEACGNAGSGLQNYLNP